MKNIPAAFGREASAPSGAVDAEATHRLSRRAALAIVAFGATLYGIHLGDVRALTFHEIVFAQPAREMVREGRWLVPTIGGQPQFDRTPVTAWCIAGAMKLFGSEAEWVVRLPAVVAAIATALMIGALGARWFGARIGLWAGLMQTTTYYALAMGRLAEADMLVCATVTAAMFAFAAAHVDGPLPRSQARWLPWAFHGAVAASFMVKWALGPAFVLAACLAYAAAARDRSVVKFLLNPGGVLVQLLIVVPWLAAAYHYHPTVVEHIYINHFRRFNGDMGMLEPWYSYTYDVPLLLLPWTPLIVPAVAARRARRAPIEPVWKLFAAWFVPGIVLLSCSSFHSRNYAIALMPPLSIVAAVGLEEYLRRRAASTRTAGKLLPAITIVAGCAAVAGLLRRRHADAEALAMLAGLVAAGLLLAQRFEAHRRFNHAAAALFATVWIVAVGAQTWVMPWHDSFRPLAELGRRVGDHAPADAVVHLVQLPEVQVPFYIDRRVRSWPRVEEFDSAGLARPSEPTYVVTSRDYVDRLAATARLEVLDAAERKSRLPQDRDRLVLLRVLPAASADASRTAGRAPTTAPR